MIPNLPVVRLILLMIASSLLTQCLKTKIQHAASPPQQTSSTPYSLPATYYLDLAKNQEGEAQQDALIMAAGRFIYKELWQNGIRVLSQTHALSPAQANEKLILLAKINLIKGEPRAAIAKLAKVTKVAELPLFYRAQYHQLLAAGYEAVGNNAEGINELIKLDHLLADSRSQMTNRHSLWLKFTNLSSAELNTMAIEAPEGSDTVPWAKLALIAKQTGQNGEEMLSQIEHWQKQYPEHLANSILPHSLAHIKPRLHASPRQIALLVPLSGALAGPGGAIRDGFMAAASTGEANASIRVYDTALGEVVNLYHQAIENGANYVVGPLSKSEVASVAAIEHPVPTLLLNDMETVLSDNVYRFGLSLSNEAKQVAIKASQEGHKSTLIISPDNVWGNEIATAFASQWQAEGGGVVDRLNYGMTTDLNAAVRELLHINDSLAREKQFKQLLGNELQTMPRRRQDFDMIFLLAYPSQARQIIPLLKYYFAHDIPVYATSTVYSGHVNARKDKDLDNIIFCDMPWVFKQQMDDKNWPETLNSYNRLYALGVDSYGLVSQLNQLLLFPGMGVNDKSGVLYLNQTRQIARIPAWGKFKGGIPVPISYS